MVALAAMNFGSSAPMPGTKSNSVGVMMARPKSTLVTCKPTAASLTKSGMPSGALVPGVPVRSGP